ncbi:MAG: hypothetical protein A2Z49_09600 [Chloroflexi bacterium RBG_19FT_COMBO_56_12]|nr:MAG: hypothetical protein A2Z49_09600 [Chloroflexi bacterium RBG_19FT_COMBO_56_12]
MHILKKLIVVFLVMALLAAGAFAWYYFYGPCGTLKAKAAINQTQAIVNRWLDAEQIAGSTSRIALAGPLSELQSIKQDMTSLKVPPCLERAQAFIVDSMERTIGAYLLFMQNEPDNKIKEAFSEATHSLGNYTAELNAITECIPFCK